MSVCERQEAGTRAEAIKGARIYDIYEGMDKTRTCRIWSDLYKQQDELAL